MNKIRHSKFKNSGIIYEQLVRTIASDVISGKDSNAINIIRKYFANNSELYKENKLYQSLINSKELLENKAESLINETINQSVRLNRKTLRKEKYNLIKELKEKYNIDEFFKTKINNYKQYAAAYNLIEAKNTSEFVDPTQIVENKLTLLEHITKKEINKIDLEDRIMSEYASMNKGTRLLVYKTLLEKFNDKYSNLDDIQKTILKEYINNVSNTVKLKEFVNSNLSQFKIQLIKLKENISDKVTEIKVNEVINMIIPLDKNQNVKDEHIISLLQYEQLITELKLIK